MPDILFDATTRGLAGSLTLTQKRHEVLASNIANVETPAFTSTKLVEDRGAPPRADGNTVEVDLQMAKLSANGGRYVALAKILGHRLALLRSAIDGSR